MEHVSTIPLQYMYAQPYERLIYLFMLFLMSSHKRKRRSIHKSRCPVTSVLQTATLCLVMPKFLMLIQLYIAQMDSVNSRAIHGRKLCKRVVLANSSMGKTPRRTRGKRLRMLSKIRPSSRPKWNSTKNQVGHILSKTSFCHNYRHSPNSTS